VEAATIFNFEKYQYLGLDEDISTNFGGQMHHGHTEMTA